MSYMIDEILTSVVSFITGQNVEKPKQARLHIGMIAGGLFFMVHFIQDLIEKTVKLDYVLVLLALSIFIGLFTYFILSLYRPDHKT